MKLLQLDLVKTLPKSRGYGPPRDAGLVAVCLRGPAASPVHLRRLSGSEATPGRRHGMGVHAK